MSLSYDPEQVLRLLDTARVDPQTKKVLKDRRSEHNGSGREYFETSQFESLKALIARVLPDSKFTLAVSSQIDHRLFKNEGNGWRYGALPVDGEAYVKGLNLIEGYALHEYQKSFACLDSEDQDRLLGLMIDGRIVASQEDLNFINLFFEEILGESTELYYSYPEALAEIGCASFAAALGFNKIGLNEREAWEPRLENGDANE